MNQLDQDRMPFHVNLVAWLNIISGAFTLLLACLAVVFLTSIGMITNDPVAFQVLSVVGWVGGGFLAVLAIPGLIAGIGLLMRQGWARYLALIASLFNLVNFPIGTVIGGYSIFVLLQDAAVTYFGKRQEAVS